MKNLLIVISVLAFSASANADGYSEAIIALEGYYDRHNAELTQSEFVREWTNKGLKCTSDGARTICGSKDVPALIAMFVPPIGLVTLGTLNQSTNSCRGLRTAALQRYGKPDGRIGKTIYWEFTAHDKGFAPKGAIWDGLCLFYISNPTFATIP